MGVLVGLCKTPKGDLCRALETGLEVVFTTHSALLAVEPGNTRSFCWTCSESADSEFREDGETPPRPGGEGALMQQSTGHMNAHCETPALDWAIFKFPLSNMTLSVKWYC